jgi:hypothetical protein
VAALEEQFFRRNCALKTDIFDSDSAVTQDCVTNRLPISAIELSHSPGLRCGGGVAARAIAHGMTAMPAHIATLESLMLQYPFSNKA